MRQTRNHSLLFFLTGCPFALAFAVRAVRADPATVEATQFVLRSLASQISPEDLTSTEMGVLELRINDYFAQNHRLPATLSDIPLRPGHGDEDTSDGWRKPIVYEPQKDGSVVLRSLGGEGHTRMVQFSVIDPSHGREVFDRDMTDSAMANIEILVHQFAAEHHRVPTRIDELPAEGAGHTDLRKVDGWGQPIRYSVQANGTVVVVSDGKPGAKQNFILQFSVPEAPKLATTKPHRD